MTEPEPPPPAPPSLLQFPQPVLSAADIPPVAAQPTQTGRRIGVSAVDASGRVAILYGDYVANTNPMSVILVAPDGSVTIPLSELPTEQMHRFRSLNGGALWSLSIDPVGSNPGFLVTDFGGTWHTVNVTVPGLPNMEHGYDVAQEPNGDLYMCGARSPDTAFVWRSGDFGQTSTEVLAYPSGEPEGYNGFFEFRRSGGRLVVSRGQGFANFTGGHYVLNNGSWQYQEQAPAFDTPAGYYVSSVGTVRNDSTGFIRRLPDPAFVWSVADAPGGGFWISDGDGLWLISDPT